MVESDLTSRAIQGPRPIPTGAHLGAAALSVRDLSVHGHDEHGDIEISRGINFDLYPGRITGLAGESGSGKTVTALAVMQLANSAGLRVASGSIQLGNRDLLSLGERQLRTLRGSRISMVFQEPTASLDPNFRVGTQIAETIRSHQQVSKRVARNRSIELLDQVGISDPARRVDAYPFEMSGGQLQRVLIAMAISNGPDVLIADEPTTALDVTVQAQIMELIAQLASDGMAVLLVTHDLGVMAEYADELFVMYAGEVVESGSTDEVLTAPQHPYSAGLIASVPSAHERMETLHSITGRVPAPRLLPTTGCRFAPRCDFAIEECGLPIDMSYVGGEQHARCHRSTELTLPGVSDNA